MSLLSLGPIWLKEKTGDLSCVFLSSEFIFRQKLLNLSGLAPWSGAEVGSRWQTGNKITPSWTWYLAQSVSTELYSPSIMAVCLICLQLSPELVLSLWWYVGLAGILEWPTPKLSTTVGGCGKTKVKHEVELPCWHTVVGFWFFPPRRCEPGARLVSPQENSPIWKQNIFIFSMFDDEQIQSELLSKQVTSISQFYWSWCWHWDAINKHVTKLLHSGSSQHHPGQFVSTCYSAPPHTHTLTDITYLFICLSDSSSTSHHLQLGHEASALHLCIKRMQSCSGTQALSLSLSLYL